MRSRQTLLYIPKKPLPLRGVFCAFFWLFCSNFCYASDTHLVYTESPPLLQLPVPQKSYIPPKKLTLREAIMLALRTNSNVRIADLQRISDKFDLEVAHNRYMPQYTFTANATFQPGSKPTYDYSPAATLLTPLGTTLGLSYSQNYLGSAGNGSSIVGTITQPLLQNFGPKITMAPLEQAEYTEHTARLNLKNTVISIVTQVIQNYYALVQAYNSLKVDQLALQNSMTLVDQYRTRIKAGQAAPLELAPQESQLASQKLQVIQDQNNIQQAYQALLTTLGLDPNSKLQIDTNITIDNSPVPSLDRSTDLALENNIGYLQALYQLKQDDISLLIAKNANRWSLNLVATKTIIPNGGGNGFTPLGGTGSTTTGGDSVQLNLTVPINDKSLQQQVVNAKVILEQQKIQLAETKRELRSNVINALQTLQFQQQQIKQAVDAVNYAQQAYEVEKIKLKYGRSTILSVTQLLTSWQQQQQSLIAQEIAYINLLAQFEQLLGISLDKWGIRLYY